MDKRTVFGVMLSNRSGSALKFQEIATKYGCNIRTRIGLHKVNDNVCSPSGLIILEAVGKDSEIANLEKELSNIEGVNLQKMVF